MKKLIPFALVLMNTFSGLAQESPGTDSSLTGANFVKQDPVRPQVYRLHPAVDVPVTAVGLGWSLYAFTKIYSKDTSTIAEIRALNKNDVASINRSSVNRYSPKAFD